MCKARPIRPWPAFEVIIGIRRGLGARNARVSRSRFTGGVNTGGIAWRIQIERHVERRRHYLPAKRRHVHWGYFSKNQPQLEVDSRRVVTIET